MPNQTSKHHYGYTDTLPMEQKEKALNQCQFYDDEVGIREIALWDAEWQGGTGVLRVLWSSLQVQEL